MLLDESGDLGFSFDKGSSKFFIVTIIFVESKRRLEKIAKQVHKTLRRKFKRVGALHAYNETGGVPSKVKLMGMVKYGYKRESGFTSLVCCKGTDLVFI